MRIDVDLTRCTGHGICETIAADVFEAEIGIKDGRIVQIGMFPGTPVAVELAALGQKEITWIGTFRFDNEVDEAIEMIAAAPSVADVVTHVIAVDQATEAFDIAKNSEISGKVLVKLDGEVEE